MAEHTHDATIRPNTHTGDSQHRYSVLTRNTQPDPFQRNTALASQQMDLTNRHSTSHCAPLVQTSNTETRDNGTTIPIPDTQLVHQNDTAFRFTKQSYQNYRASTHHHGTYSRHYTTVARNKHAYYRRHYSAKPYSKQRTILHVPLPANHTYQRGRITSTTDKGSIHTRAPSTIRPDFGCRIEDNTRGWNSELKPQTEDVPDGHLHATYSNDNCHIDITCNDTQSCMNIPKCCTLM
ncbi:putative structural protein [Syngnathus scovelli chapparvovirus]|uniref:Putative structural protein n=1 Tax=Syngnathus scovelli chapparvovirus TaxID=2662396 RepID=A0A6B9D4Q9_9VIRU|nr:putative structural protein [Syngnathus scovelli chapparvovirus]QGW62418.1 putative structural protein [Syngnathus scovelli chapparvovirus]